MSLGTCLAAFFVIGGLIQVYRHTWRVRLRTVQTALVRRPDAPGDPIRLL